VRAAAAALGGLDAVVFAASGAFEPRPPEAIGEHEWDTSMDVLARGLFFVAQAAHEQFLTQPGAAASSASAVPERGVIVALTDVGAVQPWAAFAAHCAAKAAQLMLVRTLAKAWAGDGIRVCGVAPGPVDLTDDLRREASARAAAQLPSGRLIRPQDVAAVVELCITTSGMTGTNVMVDGGALLR
jgi:pteridine reductase